ncbi:hypothetical protein UlMin_043115 [Ulmus minor]
METFFQMPEQVLEEIFSRLPPKSLFRFKCVCKSWYTVISDPSFVNKHLRINLNSCKSSTSLFLRRNLRESKQVLSLVSFCNKEDDNGDSISCVVEDLSLSLIPSREDVEYCSDFVGFDHCNGIICLFHRFSFHEPVVLCNPAIKEFKVLPKPLLLEDYQTIGCGFGYDSYDNDYKVVRIFRYIYEGFGATESRAQVYTLGTNSWREIKMDIKAYYFRSHQGVYCNCKHVYYWPNEEFKGSKDRLISFDMSKETFYSILLPDSVQKADRDENRLVMWNELLALFLYSENSLFSQSIEMWVMVDNLDGSSSTWNKHLTIGPLEFIRSPLTFWKNDELFMNTRDGEIVSYNLCSQKLRKLSIPGDALLGWTCVDDYVKSLVSVRGGN